MNGSKVGGAGCGDAKHSATKGKKNTRGVGEKEGPPGRRDTYRSKIKVDLLGAIPGEGLTRWGL